MAGSTVQSDLQFYKSHAKMFIQLANKTINDTATRQTQLDSHVDSARNSVVR